MTTGARSRDETHLPPFETADLRRLLTAFLDEPFDDGAGGQMRVGNYRWGVYAAVAMSVLDPFEVHDIEVWPLPQLEGVNSRDSDARAVLNALERLITQQAVAGSTFKAILNEKDPPPGALVVEAPRSARGTIVSDRVFELRSHPDFRIARRALIISRLAQVISERKVQGGLRRVLQTQARRLEWLAQRRYEGLGGAASVEVEAEDEDGV
jgi:hypothetical protein